MLTRRDTVHWYREVGSAMNAASFLFLLIQVISRYPINHVGFNPNWFYLVTAITCGAVAMPFTKNRAKAYGPILLWVILPITLLILDRGNFLVPYEVWLDRGMP